MRWFGASLHRLQIISKQFDKGGYHNHGGGGHCAQPQGEREMQAGNGGQNGAFANVQAY